MRIINRNRSLVWPWLSRGDGKISTWGHQKSDGCACFGLWGSTSRLEDRYFQSKHDSGAHVSPGNARIFSLFQVTFFWSPTSEASGETIMSCSKCQNWSKWTLHSNFQYFSNFSIFFEFFNFFNFFESLIFFEFFNLFALNLIYCTLKIKAIMSTFFALIAFANQKVDESSLNSRSFALFSRLRSYY